MKGIMERRFRVALVGLGDLGRRIALSLVATNLYLDLILYARDPVQGAQFARLLGGCGEASVRLVVVDALDTAALAENFARDEPDLIVQSASMLSPWMLFERKDELACELRGLGFGVQLCAQLPILLSVMRAVRASERDIKVVNCSYPDVTHAALQPLGLAPTLGIGNVGMIHNLARATLRARGEPGRVRVLAHHSHVALLGAGVRAPDSKPRIFADERELSFDDVFAGAPALNMSRDLNALSSAHAVQVVLAFHPSAAPVYTSAPGPMGLAGGWPVKLSERRVELDLPEGVSLQDAGAFNTRAARSDGIDEIASDGSVTLSRVCRDALAKRVQSLGEPLVAEQALQRFELLRALLERHAA